MSLLLDALNKADQERKRGDGPPSIDSRHDTFRAQDRAKTPTLIIVLGVGIALTALLFAVYWLGKTTQQTTTASVAPLQPVTTQAPTANINDSRKNTDVNVSAEQGSNIQQNGDVPNRNSLQNNISIPKTEYSGNSAPNNADNKFSEEEGVANLYQQQMANNQPLTAQGSGSTTATQSAQLTTEKGVVNTAPSSISQFANLPELHDLPSGVLEKIPTLKYTEHHYNQNGGSVVINGEVKHVNDQLANGVVIDKILTDGMILHVENYSFKMRAMNTWVNM